MRLSVQIEFDKTLDLDTKKSSVVVGRSPDNDLVISHEFVSRKHCRIELVEELFYITDLGSSNGTYIDGQRLKPNVRTPFLISSQLSIGKLDCELKSSTAKDSLDEANILEKKRAQNGNFTSTIRISRLDLNQPSLTLKNETKLKVKGPRNPVTADAQNPRETNQKKNKLFYFFLFILVLGIAWYFSPEK